MCMREKPIRGCGVERGSGRLTAALAVQCGQGTAIFIPLYEGVKATRDTT